MTNLTIIDQLLVLLDDEQPHPLEEMTTILHRSKQTVSSTLGRLLAKSWVERHRAARGQYQITDAGRTHVTKLLDQIKLRVESDWDGSWEQIIFNIPERDRKRRDDLRGLLVGLGYGRLHGWLWLSPWSHRVEIERYIIETHSEADITIVRTGALDQATSRRFGQLFEWDWQSLETAYDAVIHDATAFLAQPKKASYRARCLVYHYAKVLATDPKLPSFLPSRVTNATAAFELYQRVRPFCYQE